MIVYLLESFGILLVASGVFFLLGTSFGWVLWGRYKKMLAEWRSNSERLNKRIANLEDEADRGNLSRHVLETEKGEILEVFARRNREFHATETDLGQTQAALTEREAELVACRAEIDSRDEEIRLFRFDVQGLMEALAKRDALVEALNDRIETVQRDRDDRIGILKAKLIAAEQERDESRNEATKLARRVASDGKLVSSENAGAGKRRSAGARSTKPSAAGSRKPSSASAEVDEVAVTSVSRSRRAAKRAASEPVAKASQMDLGLNS